MVHLKCDGILNNVPEMFTALHVILAAVMVVAYVRNFLVLTQFIVLYTELIVVIVFVVLMVHDVVAVLLRQL